MEELNGGTVSSYFYRNQQELEGETGTAYGQVKDPFAAEQKEAEEREKATSAKSGTGSARPGTPGTGTTPAPAPALTPSPAVSPAA